MAAVTIDLVTQAGERIRRFVHRTPVMTCRSLDEMTGASLFFKCENFQKTGSFKFRGACNAVFSLSEEAARRGVVTHSSGNHAQALALAARLRGIPATVVMPSDAPRVKVAAVRGYGASIRFCEPTLADREATALEIIETTGATFIHPYDDVRVVAGQGTATLEFLQEVPNLDVIVAPVGGGGLLSGTAVAAKGTDPRVVVYGAEPAAADDARRSLHEGQIVPSENPVTIADGLRTSLSDLTFAIIREGVEDIGLASEEGIAEATKLVFERAKLVVEPSAAVPLAALLEGSLDLKGARVGIILSGGNVDLSRLPFARGG